MSYLNDPREMAIRPESGVTLEEDNRYEPMYHWGAHVLDLCGLPVEEYMKPMTVNVNGGGGGGSDTGSTENPTYTLKFVLDGTTKKTYSLEEGAPIPEVSGEKEGYDFSGWKDASGQTYTTMPGSNLTLYGTTTIKKFTVTFTVDGEPLAEYEQEVEWGKKVTNIPSSAKTGYNFSGWQPAIPSTIKSDYDFVGTFTKKSYTVTFKISGAQQTAVVEYGDTIEYPAADSKEGYVICGWTPYYETMPDVQNLVFNAVLSAIPYTATFLVDLGEGMDYEVVTAHTLTIGQTIPSVAVPTQSGYSFTSWSADTQITNNKMPASNVNFYTKKTVNNYTLTYFVDGTQEGEVETHAYGEKLTLKAKPEKEGYTVSDWTFTPALNEVPQELGGGVSMPYSNVVANSETHINSYNVTIKYGNTVLFNQDVEYGTTIASLIPEGYTYGDGEVTVPAHDIVISVAINQYNVTVSGDASFTLTLNYGEDVQSAIENYVNANYQNELIGKHVETNVPSGATVPAHDVSYNVTFVPNQHTMTVSGYGSTNVYYGQNILEVLDGVVTIDNYHTLDRYEINGQVVTAADTVPDNDFTVVPFINVKESEVTPVVSGETIGSATTYDYGTPIADVIEDIVETLDPQTQEDIEDPGYEVEWTVNGSAYTEGMVVEEDNITVEVTITPKPFKLAFVRNASGPIGGQLIESGETLYKEGIVYPATPANIVVGDTTYEFKWDVDSVSAGTPMPSHDVTVYGAYYEVPMASDIIVGYLMNSDLSGGTANIEAKLLASASTFALSALPEYHLVTAYADPEFAEEETDEDEWAATHGYSLLVAIPDNKTLTGFRTSTPTSTNYVGAQGIETYYGKIMVNGSSYKLYGYYKPSNYYITDITMPWRIYLTIE